MGLRETWKAAKAAATAKGVDMKNVADKANFGPLLDKFEAEHKAYDAFMEKQATNPDTAKEKAAKKKVTDAATAAYAAAGKYAAALKQVEDHSTGATKAATTALLNVLSMQICVKLKK